MRSGLVILLLVVLSLLTLAFAPGFGIEWISPWPWVAGRSELEQEILLRIRIPRVLMAYLAGSALALSGLAFQSIFRNALATPFTLGVSSGAALGAALYIRLGWAFSLLGVAGLSWAAFVGALFSIGLVYGLTRLKGGFSTATLLLAGVAINFSFSSLILFIQFISEFSQSFKIVRWMMGSIDVADYAPVWQLGGLTLGGGLLLMLLSRELDLLMSGDEIAISRGVHASRVKGLVFIVISLLVGTVVAWCGPIGFVGMMVPHMSRLLVGSGHRTLLPATVLVGGTFLTLCDTFARSVIPPAEIPTGVITALLGGPFFIALLLGKK